MLHTLEADSWKTLIPHVFDELADFGEVVKVGEWQSLRGGEKDPRMTMLEINDVILQAPIPVSVRAMNEQINPNLPWANDHFLERVGGEPLNPGEQYKNWPYYRGNVEEHKQPGQFSHTYMERMWPKQAGHQAGNPIRSGHPMFGFYEERGTPPNNYAVQINGGIRYGYGDLADVVSLLQKSPGTRQAFLPIWFPEDTGAVHGERVPCSIGYHFLLRAGRLYCTYFIRSCDIFRHFRDDVYLACRLTKWVADKVHEGRDVLYDTGCLTMHIINLHCFSAEQGRLRDR